MDASRVAWPAVVMALGAMATAQRSSAPRFSHGASAVTVGPAPAGMAGYAVEDCATCHREIAEEWRGSEHAGAWTDPTFTAAFRVEPLPFCVRCHAPLAEDGTTRPDERSAREGVSCAVCHVREGQVFAGASGGGGGASGSPHAVTRDAWLGASGYCGGCHQFGFPLPEGWRGPPPRRPPMQDTLGEWLTASRGTGETCQGCHMPWRVGADGRRWRSHRFPGARDASMLREAVRVAIEAERDGDGVTVRATLSLGRIGHAFPTGDVMRRGVLRVWPEGDESRAVTTEFARWFAVVSESDAAGRPHPARRPVNDSRVGVGGPARVELRVGGRASRVRWRLEHQRMPPEHARRQGVSEAVNVAVMLEGAAEVAPSRRAGGDE